MSMSPLAKAFHNVLTFEPAGPGRAVQMWLGSLMWARSAEWARAAATPWKGGTATVAGTVKTVGPLSLIEVNNSVRAGGEGWHWNRQRKLCNNI